MNIVIIAGGAGTRLWPMSTPEKPKQFQALVSNKSLLQETYDRVSFCDDSHIFVSTNKESAHWVREQLPQISEENIIIEPSRQDTGPSMGLTAALIAKRDPEAVIVMVSADHLVQDQKEFERAVNLAVETARIENTLNIVEVRAKAPNVNLGYVKMGEELSPGVNAFIEFKEKPDSETAKRFVADGSYLWNTGYYVWKASTLLEAFAKHLPETYKQLYAIQNGASIEEHYPLCERISIDYGIMEKVQPSQVRLIPADFTWSDIGTWAALHDELAETPESNVIKGKVTALDCKGCLIYNERDEELAIFGLNNVVMVQTKEHTLVCSKNQSVHLKQLLNARTN